MTNLNDGLIANIVWDEAAVVTKTSVTSDAFLMNNSSTTSNHLVINNNGTGAALQMTQNGSASGVVFTSHPPARKMYCDCKKHRLYRAIQEVFEHIQELVGTPLLT